MVEIRRSGTLAWLRRSARCLLLLTMVTGLISACTFRHQVTVTTLGDGTVSIDPPTGP